MYSARVSVPLAGTFSFSHNSDISSVCAVQRVARRLAPADMVIFLSFSIAVTPYRPPHGGLT